MIIGLPTPKARKLTAWGASPRNSLCPDSQGRSENAVGTCKAGSRRSAPLPVVGTRSRAIRAHTSTGRRTPNAKAPCDPNQND
jgi:hypothetical protein